MNKILILAICFFSQLALADDIEKKVWDPKPMVEGNRRVDELIEWNKDHPGEMPPLTKEEEQEYFIKEGVPVPGSGAHVVPSANLKMDSKQKLFTTNYNSMQKTKGYYDHYSKPAAMLLQIPEIAEKDLESHKLLAVKDTDTDLRETIQSLPMNYFYRGVPMYLVQKVIGYAPEHTFVGNGWNGAVEFFISHDGYTCAYHEINISLTKTAAYIPTDVATYQVNGKITTVNIEGNDDSGYMYDIEWWDHTFKRNLNCVAHQYSISLKNMMVSMAKKIDAAS